MKTNIRSEVCKKWSKFLIGLSIYVLRYYFKNECECFITISKHKKTDGSMRPLRPSAFIVFKCLEIVMKHEARVFEMTSLKKQYKIIQCHIFPIFSLKCLVCVICRIQSAFIVIVLCCTKFVFQKRCELEMIYILSVFAMAEGRFRLLKTIQEEELSVDRAVLKSTRYIV